MILKAVDASIIKVESDLSEERITMTIIPKFSDVRRQAEKILHE